MAKLVGLLGTLCLLLAVAPGASAEEDGLYGYRALGDLTVEYRLAPRV